MRMPGPKCGCKDRGWVRIDPTAAISPARIQSGLNAALPDNAALPFLVRTQSPLLLKLRFNLDALTNQWNQWVLGYNTERQFAFLTRLGMEDITWQKMAINMLAGVALLVGIFTLHHAAPPGHAADRCSAGRMAESLPQTGESAGCRARRMKGRWIMRNASPPHVPN